MPDLFRGQPLQSPERPDTFFGLVAGLYVAALVSPLPLLAVAVWVSGDPAVLYLGFLGIVTLLTTAVTWGVTRVRGLATRLGRTSLAWLLPLLGVLGIVANFVFATGVEAPSAGEVGITGFFLGLFAMLLGFALLAMSRTRYAKAVVDENTVELTFSAGWPERQRLRVVAGATALLIASSTTLVLRLLGVIDRELHLLGFVPGFAGVALSLGTERTYRVTPDGLERRMPVLGQFYPWDSFAGFSLTGDAVVVHRRTPWQLDFRCARDDIEDVDTVRETLEQYLDRHQ